MDIHPSGSHVCIRASGRQPDRDKKRGQNQVAQYAEYPGDKIKGSLLAGLKKRDNTKEEKR